MFCKHCGTKINDKNKVCPNCGKKAGSDGLKIALMAVAGVLVVALMAGIVYVGTNGWPDFGGSSSVDGTTPPNGNPDDVSCKGSYSAKDDVVLAAKDTVVATMGEHKLTNGQLQVYYWMGVSDFLNYYGNYIAYFGLDLEKPLDQQIYDQETGQSWQQYFLKTALDSWKRDQALAADAAKENFQIGADYQDYLDNLYKNLQETAEENKFDSVEDMLKADMGGAADFAGYQYYIQRYYMANLYYNEAYKKLAVTDKEIEDYFKENAEDLKSQYGVTKESGTVTGLQYIMFYPEGATAETIEKDTFSDSAWEASRAKLQNMLDKWVSEGATEAGFRALIEEVKKSGGTAGTGGELSGLTEYFSSEVDVRHILIEPEDDTEAAMETCRKQAQALLDSWIAGGATEEAFAKLAKEYTADSNGSQGGLYENVQKGDMVAEFDAWIFDASRKPGDSGLVKTQFGYHIMYFVHGDTAVDAWTFEEGRALGDYTIAKSDYGYYLLRHTGTEEGWVYYSKDAVQAEKMEELIQKNYTMEVSYSDILLAEVDLSQ